MEIFDMSSKNNWGGSWTEQKLDCFESYVKAYLTIMNVYRDKRNWKLIYFDGFAGSGDRGDNLSREDETALQAEMFDGDWVQEREVNLYQGAAERVVRLEQMMRGFDYYYFVEKDESKCAMLDLKLAQYETKGYKKCCPGDANDWAKKLGDALHRDTKYKSLCLLDPFGMSIKWDTIERLSGNGVDLWILVPTGVIINRLVRKSGELMHTDRLEEFFGMTKSDIHDWFYERRQEVDLFGETQEWYEKKDNPIQRIADLFCERLGELFKYVTPEPLVMRNRNNVPIFHFVCASNNQTAVRIASDIIDKRQ